MNTFKKTAPSGVSPAEPRPAPGCHHPRQRFRRQLPVLGLLVIGAAAASGVELHVAAGGSDANPGTPARPFATLTAARDAARTFAGREAVEVVVGDGVHYLPATFVLSAEDSGSRVFPVVYRAAREGGAVLSGGMKLDLAWAPFRGGLFKAATPAGLAIDQLFVNGVRQRMARYPNFDATQTTAAYQGFAADAFSKERAANWADPAGGFIHAMHAACWGGYHYRITGKNPDGTVAYEGGWQNNRQMGMHKSFRMVENIFEELDAPGEWFHDPKTATLYLMPAAGVDLPHATIEVVRLRHLVELRGTPEKPVRFVTLRGFVFRHAARTFMDTREPLLRSDWTVYRGGALLIEGAEDCTVADATFDQLGGNAVFVNNHNRRVVVRGCHIHDTGASAVAFVGDPAAVRNPLFEYRERQDYGAIDRTPGPKTGNHPADCAVEDCLIERAGVVEKQATGVQISMAQGIAVRHCSIYDMSRAGINISEGTWGGHLVEFCDVFDTVKETGDHGSFNSWGRDRFWGLRNAPPDELPELALLDAVKPTVLRNNRWRCDHGWDVDLDDGSSNYAIYNNLFLHGGLKLREGFHRRVWNNIAVNNTLHPHVWYDNSRDIVTNNIWMGAYRPAGGMPKGRWGDEVDRNFFTSEADRTRFAAHGCDAHSLAGDPLFVAPATGDFRVKDGSPALKMGFRNFPMDRFGVMKGSLRAIARTPEIPAIAAAAATAPGTPPAAAQYWLGAALHALEGEEFSAFGVAREDGGVQIVDAPAGSAAAAAGLRKNDLVQAVNGGKVRGTDDLFAALVAAADAPLQVQVVRGQSAQALTIPGAPFVRMEAADAGGTFTTLVPPAAAAGSVTASRTTANDPLATLVDGKLGKGYGPVFPNGVSDGAYKMDLGAVRPVGAITSWSWNQNGTRGRQIVTLFASDAEADPGWNTGDGARFTPLATLDTGRGGTAGHAAISLRARPGASLGRFRWIVWRVQPVTKLAENTAFQELAVEPPK